MINKLQQIAEDNQFDIDLANLYCKEDTFEDFNEKVYEAIANEEIIYYYEAMKYLSEEDASLSESLEIAIYNLDSKGNNIDNYILTNDLYRYKSKFTNFKVLSCIKKQFNTITF